MGQVSKHNYYREGKGFFEDWEGHLIVLICSSLSDLQRYSKKNVINSPSMHISLGGEVATVKGELPLENKNHFPESRGHIPLPYALQRNVEGKNPASFGIAKRKLNSTTKQTVRGGKRINDLQRRWTG